MNRVKFEQLITYWSLKGKISDGMDMGTKGLGKERRQVKRILIDSKNYHAVVTYIVNSEDDFQINYCDIRDKTRGTNEFYVGDQGLRALEEL